MLEGVEDLANTNTEIKEDLKSLKLIVQWKIDSLNGYQIFDNGKYVYKQGGVHPNPDLVCIFINKETVKKLFEGKLRDFRMKVEGKKYRIRFIEKEEDMNKVILDVPFEDFDYDLEVEFSADRDQRLIFLSRIPVFNTLFKNHYDPDHSRGSAIPINVKLGTYENQMVPMVVLEHFLKKANLRYLVDCGCRIGKNCKDYDYRTGCMYLGKGVEKLALDLPWRIEKHAHLATYEEAIAQARKAVESGLVPVMGRYRAEAAVMYALPDEGNMLTICYCCPCCCVQGVYKYGSATVRKIFQRMEGLEVIFDKELCVGCGECLDVCIYDGIQMVDNKAQKIRENCLGCGRCERVCQNGAIKITIDDPKRLDEFIKTIEEYVNVL
ncbi:MAG: 4Fe-4S binding protein [Candidatus Lokiarchaeota archaeon]|nr:4Fe-4S binding protein [Candidatus Lokiarchaeota archaeon]